MRAMKDSGIEWIGDIPEEWKKEKIFRLFRNIGSGTTPKSSDESAYCGEVNWIQSGDINGYILTASNKSVSNKALEEYSALKVYTAPFIVMAMYGASIGNLAISQINACVNQACCVLSCSTADFKFLFYNLVSAKSYLIHKGVGGGQPNISQDIIKQLWLPLPPLPEQQRIAAYLDEQCGEIDKVLAKTRESIEEYKKLKQSVITEAVTKGIRPNRPMKPSGIEWIGDIPEGWDICRKLSYLCTRGISYGIVKLYDPDDENGVFVLRCSDVLPGKISLENVRTVTQEVSQEYARTILTGGEIVINVRGTLGGCAVVPNELKGFNIAREVAVIPLSAHVSNKFYMYFLLSSAFREYEHSHLSGSVYVGLNIELLASTPVLTPPLSEQQEIVAYLDQQCAEIDRLIAKKEQIITELESYKKSLIYECVTGKREVE